MFVSLHAIFLFLRGVEKHQASLSHVATRHLSTVKMSINDLCYAHIFPKHKASLQLCEMNPELVFLQFTASSGPLQNKISICPQKEGESPQGGVLTDLCPHDMMSITHTHTHARCERGLGRVIAAVTVSP